MQYKSKNPSLTTSLELSFSGVWGGSVAAGLLDGMAKSGSVKPSVERVLKKKKETKKWNKIKTWERPSEAPGAASFNLSVGRSVGRSVAHSVLPLSWEKKERKQKQRDWRYSTRTSVKFE